MFFYQDCGKEYHLIDIHFFIPATSPRMANCKATFRADSFFTKQQGKVEFFLCNKRKIVLKLTIHKNSAVSK